jgi:hypothetical protein
MTEPKGERAPDPALKLDSSFFSTATGISRREVFRARSPATRHTTIALARPLDRPPTHTTPSSTATPPRPNRNRGMNFGVRSR